MPEGGGGQQEYLRMEGCIEGDCIVYDVKRNVSWKRYLKFYKTTLFVMKGKNDEVPEDIINL